MPPKQLKAIITGGILIVFVSGLALLLYAGGHLGEALAGPSKLARAADDTLWVVSHRHLHQFNRDGMRLQKKVALDELGVTGIVSGIAVAGSNAIFIAQAEPSRLYRCALLQTTCTDLTPAVAKTGGAPTQALMLAADIATKRLAVSDNGAHRLLLTDFDGNVLSRSMPYRFYFPNQPSWLSADEIAIADTNHHRIVTIGIKDDVIAEQRSAFRTDGNPQGRDGRVWPMDAQRGNDGKWWVLNAQNGMRNADLLRFDNDGKPLTRVDLGGKSDPMSIALIGADVLVADPLHATLTRVTPAADGFARRAFGDAAFQSELRQLESDRILWSRARIAAQIMLIAGPFVGIFLLWRLGEPLARNDGRIKRPDSGVQPLAPDGIHWLSVNPRFARRGRWLWFGHLLLCAVLAGVVYFWTTQETPQSSYEEAVRKILLTFGVAVGLFILFDVYMMVRGPAGWRIRLGTDGQVLMLDRGHASKQLEHYPFSSVATSGRQLLAGRHIIPLSTMLGTRFDHDELSGYLLTRMPPSAFVSAPEFLRRALQNGNRATWLVVIAAGSLIGWQLLSWLFPGLVAAWKSSLSYALISLLGIRQ